MLGESQLVRKRYIIPNFFTGLNFLLGVYAILIAASFFRFQNGTEITLLGRAPLMLAAWLIVWCTLLDKLDGFAAKLMNASSGFGAQFDSLADLIAFGIAPGFIAYFYLHHKLPDWSRAHFPLLLCSLTVYVLCTAMRLARFNAKDMDELEDLFHGLPSTYAGGFVSVSIILLEKYALLPSIGPVNYLLPLILIILGALMISPLHLPKLIKRKKHWLNQLQVLGIVSGYICGFGMILPEYLFLLLILYGGVGFSHYLLQKRTAEIQSVE